MIDVFIIVISAVEKFGFDDVLRIVDTVLVDDFVSVGAVEGFGFGEVFNIVDAASVDVVRVRFVGRRDDVSKIGFRVVCLIAAFVG